MIQTGLDVLLTNAALLREMRARRVGLLTNSAAITHDARPNIEALRAAGVNLVALFSPEHGLGGAAVAGEQVASGTHAQTGLPVHSLYGETKKPTPGMLSGLDVLLFDLQDVGVRFYTFTTTLAYALEACAENGVELVVLDRPNPIGGIVIEGPVLQPDFESFVGHGPLPIRYALTIGELAQFYVLHKNEKHPERSAAGNYAVNSIELRAESKGAEPQMRVVGMRGWRRDMRFDETCLPWAAPSPNMPYAHTALFYPGMGLAGEGANLSIGALTPLPFERIGAPWLDGDALAQKMNALDLPGVRFRATSFVPTANQYRYADEACQGVQVHIMDRAKFRPVALGLHLMHTIKHMHPDEWQWNARHFDLLMGNSQTREMLDDGAGVDELMRGWVDGLREFEARRREVILYA